MTKKSILKLVFTGMSASLALLPFLGVKPYFNGLDELSGMMLLPIVLGLIASFISFLFLKFRPHENKLIYYPSVTILSFAIFSIVFSLFLNTGGHHELTITQLGAGLFLATLGTFAFWPYVLISVISFILSDLLIEKFVD
jgi:hypothetical protein